MNSKALNTIGTSAKRIGLLIRNRFYDEGPGLGIGLGVIAGINLLSLLMSGSVWFNDPHYLTAWTFAIFVGMIVLSLNSFRGMHDGKAGVDWMLLPASPLEKYLAAALDCFIIYPLLAAGSATLLSWLLSLIQTAVQSSSQIGTMPRLNPEAPSFWSPLTAGGFRLWGELAIMGSIIMAGSATFRKNPLIKTAGIAIVYSLVMGGIIMIAALIFFKGRNFNFGYTLMGDMSDFEIGNRVLSSRAGNAIKVLFDIAQYALLPLFTVFYGYFKVYEKEARDEVQ